MRDHLDLHDSGIERESRRTDRRPCRMRRFDELVLHLDEGLKLRIAIAFEVRAAPDVEGVDHRNLRETRAGCFERRADLAEGAAELALEGFDVPPFAFL